MSDLEILAKFMTDLWNLIKNNWDIQQGDEYWDHLLAEAEAVAGKYKATGKDTFEMAKALTVAFLREQEAKERRLLNEQAAAQISRKAG